MGVDGEGRGRYGRTSMRFSSAPAWSGMMISHSCFAAAMAGVEAKSLLRAGVGWRRVGAILAVALRARRGSMLWGESRVDVRELEGGAYYRGILVLSRTKMASGSLVKRGAWGVR